MQGYWQIIWLELLSEILKQQSMSYLFHAYKLLPHEQHCKVFLSTKTSETLDIFRKLLLKQLGRQRVLFSPRRYFLLPHSELIVNRCGSRAGWLGWLGWLFKSFVKDRDESSSDGYLAKQCSILLASEIQFYLALQSELLYGKRSLDCVHEHIISRGEPHYFRAGG